jgi:hypothetical protein
MPDNGEQSEKEEFRGARIQVLGTNADDPEDGRVFVWTKMGWFERLEGQWGDVAFTPVAESEEELREMVSRDNKDADLTELTGEFKEQVADEFLEQSPSYTEAPGDANNEDDEEDIDNEDDQEFHTHDL